MKESDIMCLIDEVERGVENKWYSGMSYDEIKEEIVPNLLRDYDISSSLAEYVAETIYAIHQNINNN